MSNGSVVYFVLTNGLLKIGSGGSRARVRAGLTYGGRLLACVPADYAEEQLLHNVFRDLRVELDGSKELYQVTPEIEAWLFYLADHGYSAPDYESAVQLPALPFSVWAPGSQKQYAIHDDGQMYLFDRLPFVERLILRHKDAILSSKGDDWYTPKEWADRARAVMGSIDLDPASCAEANRHYIFAKNWYNKEINGLDETHPWFGNLWLNPPYGRGNYSAKAFIARLAREITAGTVQQAITCLNVNSTTSLWFEPLWQLDAVHCFPRSRINFIAPAASGQDGASPNKGTVFTYIGQQKDKFAKVFGTTGAILADFKTQNGQPHDPSP